MGAAVVVLEERYLGESLPTTEFHTDTLKHLFTLEQRVMDMEKIGETYTKMYPGVKIILLGCSQGGLIATLARRRYPHLFIGAVASSTAFNYKLKDAKFMEVVSNNFANPNLGGGPECLKAVTEAHLAYGEAVKRESDRRHHEDMFCLAPGALNNDEDQAVWALSGNILKISLISNEPNCYPAYCNIEKICSRFKTGKDTTLEALADIFITKYYLQKGKRIQYLWENLVAEHHQIDNTISRLLVFGRCLMGYAQICTPGKCPLHTGIDWFYYLAKICQDVFGISEDELKQNVAKLNNYIGDNLHGATNILSINGGADPWYPSSITRGRKGLDVYWIPDASHCYWCLNPNRALIAHVKKVIEKWLAASYEGSHGAIRKIFSRGLKLFTKKSHDSSDHRTLRPTT